MLPVEITSLQTGLTTSGTGIREPDAGKPFPVDSIDLVIVPASALPRPGTASGGDGVL